MALDALLDMYTQTHKSNERKRRDECKLRFVQTTAEKARTKTDFLRVLKAQQEAQRTFASVDRKNESHVYKAYGRLSLTTAQMLDFYLQCSDWSEEHYKPLLCEQLQTYGLDTGVLSVLSECRRQSLV